MSTYTATVDSLRVLTLADLGKLLSRQYGRSWHPEVGPFAARQTTAISDGVFLNNANLSTIAAEPKWRRPWTVAADEAGRWWIADAPSFSLAAMRIGVIEVERRALGNSANMSGTDLKHYFWALLGHSPQTYEAVTATIATHRRNEPQLPEPGRNWAGEYQLKLDSATSWFRGLKRAFIGHAHAGSGKSRAASVFARAFELAYAQSWQVMHQARSVVGVGYLCSSTQRARQLDATRQARTSLRHNMLRRCAGTRRPGQVVTASPRVCRGPNSAGEQPTRTHLRSAPTY
ncbi:hypothetical protein [Nocardia salmonicida]|uniref:hypothetical protein n=1 Tax=Nocardia salmonicida TaxID=53431 RepID=UPI002E282D30|nr:hypothetical protein [Nocardia salmonicida]